MTISLATFSQPTRKKSLCQKPASLPCPGNRKGFSAQEYGKWCLCVPDLGLRQLWSIELLPKLLDKIVEEKMCCWIHSSISATQQESKVMENSCCQLTLRQDVHQGKYILSPPFIIFIDDIAEELTERVSRAFYCDDISAWNAVENLTTAIYRMQKAHGQVTRWAFARDVETNSSKIFTTLFHCHLYQKR